MIGKSRHLLFMASALYDSYIFFRGLQHSKEALSSQFYDFAVMLGLFGQLELIFFLEKTGGKDRKHGCLGMTNYPVMWGLTRMFVADMMLG